MNSPNSIQTQIVPAQAAQSNAAMPPAGKQRRWFEFDTPSEMAQPAAQAPGLSPDDAAPMKAVLQPKARERRLYWSWEFDLVIGDEVFPRNQGTRVDDFSDNPSTVMAALRRCDSLLDSDIATYISRRTQNSIANILRQAVGPGETPKTEVLVKLNYNIKVWMVGERERVIAGKDEYTIQLDRQIRGHMRAVTRTFEQRIFRFAKGSFRDLASKWIKGLPPSPATEVALWRISQDVARLFPPVLVEEDALPPVLHDIVVAVL
jgi:hypothetical protein